MSDRRRRKSLSIFRPALTGLTPIHGNQDQSPDSAPALLKKRHTDSFADPPSPSPSATSLTSDLEPTNSRTNVEKLFGKSGSRPHSLQRTRPSSIFGSFRSLHSLQDEEEDSTSKSSASDSAPLHSVHSHDLEVTGPDRQVLYHGDVQLAGGMFRKKSQYLVLTDRHLIRFKSMSRASDIFPSIPASKRRRNDEARHSRLSSSGSLHELQTSSAIESYHPIPLNHVVAIYKLDDGRPYFSIEIAHLDQDRASAMTLQLSDPRESEIWLSNIRTAIQNTRIMEPLPFPQKMIEYTARALEQERDYDPHHFHMFKVVQRASKSGGRSSSDDLTKLTTIVCILAVGMYKVHLIPLPKSTRTASNTSLSDMVGCSHGIMTLTSLYVQSFDDTFQLNFRIPLRHQSPLFLASSCVHDIALWIRHAADFLRPNFLEQPFTWNVPQSLDDELLPVASDGEDHRCFDRTLTAYCAAYDIDTSIIRYTVNYRCEDAPGFELLAPADARRSRYDVLELLAVMRSLRYNEAFNSISFRNVDLTGLHGQRDPHGDDHVPYTTKSGEPINMPQQRDMWLLIQEIQALALKSKKLRRLDFTNCIKRIPIDFDDARDVGCGICEAIFPLCARQLTNVDWISLNGIALADADIDYLYAAAINKLCHFRALDLGNCALGDRSLQICLHAISNQDSTMESIDLSGNPARLDPDFLNLQLRDFGFIRKMNLSNVHRRTGPGSLIAANVLHCWKLEQLHFNNTYLNQQDVDVLSGYLKSLQSDTLRQLGLNQCNLTGSQVAQILQAMFRGVGNVRPIHLHITKNQLEIGHDSFVEAVSRSMTPRGITMQMLVYKEERHFRNLVLALANNTSLVFLDISKVSIPTDAGDDTSEALEKMFAENRTLCELDISGEQAHLEAASLGIGLNRALMGLRKNENLRELRVENQGLGFQGASTLASVFEENKGLQEVHCENNEISLQAFTILVKSLEQNYTLLYLSNMDPDRDWSLNKVKREVENVRDSSSMMNLNMSIPGKGTVRKTLGAAMAGQRSSRTARPGPMPVITTKDAHAAVTSLASSWDSEIGKLQQYLGRNYNLVHGFPAADVSHQERPATAIRDSSFEGTPTCEADLQLGQTAEDMLVQEKDGPASSPDELEGDLGLMMGEKLHIS